MENILDGIKSRLDSAEEKISELVATATETIQNKNADRKKGWKKEQNFSNSGTRTNGLTDL